MTVVALLCLAVILIAVLTVETQGKEGAIAGKIALFVMLAIPFAVLLVGLVRG